MNAVSKNELRFPFSRQPAHCIIVDLTFRLSSESLQEIVTGISNFFSLVCAMSTGSRRVPYFAMFVMTPYSEVVLPFQKIAKSSYTRIESALSDIRKLFTDGTVRTLNKIDRKSLEHCIRDTASQFHKIKQNVSTVTKLELTLMMNRNPEDMKSSIAEALSRVNLTDISHVSGISLVTSLDEGMEGVNSSPCIMENLDDPTKVNGLDLNGVLEVTRIDCDFLSIESLMRNWLSDRSIDREHLHILFTKINSEKNLLIKCDIRERLIDVTELPHRQCFEISTDIGENFITQAASSTKSARPSLIIVLRAVKRVQSSSICESIVFGKPLLLSSSNCWQMEWDELETNQNHFNALCKSLSDGKEALICENITPSPCRRGVPQIERPRGLFLLMASRSLDSLMLKSISCRELLLSAQIPAQSHWEIVPKSAMDDIERALNFVETEIEFNPLLSDSGLIQSLRASVRDSSTHKRDPVKKYPPSHHLTSGSTGNVATPSFHSANLKPATGKAARFVAPRPAPGATPTQGSTQNKSNDVPICLGPKQRVGKTVTFPDFTDF